MALCGGGKVCVCVCGIHIYGYLSLERPEEGIGSFLYNFTLSCLKTGSLTVPEGRLVASKDLSPLSPPCHPVSGFQVRLLTLIFLCECWNPETVSYASVLPTELFLLFLACILALLHYMQNSKNFTFFSGLHIRF